MKKLIAFLMAAAVIISSAFLAISAFADDVEWRYDSDTATIYIFGSGDMDDYSSPYITPWSTYLLLINNVVVEEGVNSLGNCVFAGAENLSNVSLADSVSRIGSEAFSSCPSLLELTLSSGVVN
ncbi:MAG: leucine-rich repeat protein, partial [Eubacterium sp.]|nr:leucine-rich repeat protein [Eubacterium sp.]